MKKPEFRKELITEERTKVYWNCPGCNQELSSSTEPLFEEGFFCSICKQKRRLQRSKEEFEDWAASVGILNAKLIGGEDNGYNEPKIWYFETEKGEIINIRIEIKVDSYDGYTSLEIEVV
jgi:hypothetical protein